MVVPRQARHSLHSTEFCFIMFAVFHDFFFFFQEFECGVHFGGGENSKQEWSFTLYDFDGHGKITKEVCSVFWPFLDYVYLISGILQVQGSLHHKSLTFDLVAAMPTLVQSGSCAGLSTPFRNFASPWLTASKFCHLIL